MRNTIKGLIIFIFLALLSSVFLGCAKNSKLPAPKFNWIFSTKGSDMGDLFISGNSIYVGLDKDLKDSYPVNDRQLDDSSQGFVLSINKHTGKEKWRFKINSEQLLAAKNAGGLVYFVTAKYVQGSSTEMFLNFYSADVKTGKAIKRFKDSHLFYSPQEIAADDSTVFLAGLNKSVYSLDIKTGRINWKYNVGAGRVMELEAGNRLVELTIGDNSAPYSNQYWSGELMLDAKTGKVIVRPKSVDSNSSLVCLIGNLAIVKVGSKLSALNLNTGFARWHLNFEGYEGAYADKSYIVDGNKLIFVGRVGGLSVKAMEVDVLTGKRLWQSETSLAKKKEDEDFSFDSMTANNIFINRSEAEYDYDEGDGTVPSSYYPVSVIAISKTGRQLWEMSNKDQVFDGYVLSLNKMAYIRTVNVSATFSATCRIYAAKLK